MITLFILKIILAICITITIATMLFYKKNNLKIPIAIVLLLYSLMATVNRLKIIGIILTASWIIMFIVEKKGIKNNVKTY